MAAHAHQKNAFTEDEKCHNLTRWLIDYLCRHLVLQLTSQYTPPNAATKDKLFYSTVKILCFWTDGSWQTEQSDYGLPCLPFCMHPLDASLCGKTTLFKFQNNYSNFWGVRCFCIFTVLLCLYLRPPCLFHSV